MSLSVMSERGYASDDDENVIERMLCEDSEDQTFDYALSTQNRFEQRKNGGHGEFKTVSRKRKRIVVVVWRRLLACKPMINLFAYMNN